MTVTAPKPGLYPDVPLADYLRWPILSQSVLKEGRASMAHLKSALDRERLKVPTDDMLLGSALHTCFLEPERMPERVVLWDGPRRAGKEWDEFCADHKDKVILTKGYHQKLVGMAGALRRHPFVREWTGKIEHTECAAVGNVHGVTMKGRCDALTPEPLVDLKKVTTAHPGAITKTVLNFGYHMQAYVYRKLFNRDRFVLVVVEDEPPYDVVVYEFSPAFLRQGEREAVPLLDRYQFAVEQGKWPGRSEHVVQLELPEWAMTGSEGDGLTIDGAAVFEEAASG